VRNKRNFLSFQHESQCRNPTDLKLSLLKRLNFGMHTRNNHKRKKEFQIMEHRLTIILLLLMFLLFHKQLEVFLYHVFELIIHVIMSCHLKHVPDRTLVKMFLSIKSIENPHHIFISICQIHTYYTHDIFLL